jgi:uncharacterized RDD family membrane protein YckC
MTDPAARELPDHALGRRIGGAIIDLVLLSLLLVPIALAFDEARIRSGSVSVRLQGPGLAAFIGASVLYYIVLELPFGATIGKLLVGVRVRSEDLGRAAPWQVVVRNLLRPIDVLPALYALGFLVVMLSAPTRRQRIGDRVARTVVVPRSALKALAAPGEDALPAADYSSSSSSSAREA